MLMRQGTHIIIKLAEKSIVVPRRMSSRRARNKFIYANK